MLSKPKENQARQPLLSEECREELRTLIEGFSGCEVFAIGTCDESGTIEGLDPLAFGNWDSVPAPAQNARPGQVLIHNHPSGELEPSGADIQVASLYGKSGVGFYIIDNTCERVRVVVKPFREEKVVELNASELSALFGPDGRLAHAMPGYEFRPQQLQMLEFVARAFNEGRIAVVEAGTGTGKSFAYLAPATSWALANKQRVVVSTNTINLQEQLLNKDLPELRQKLGLDFKAVLVKGRSNYVSLRRLQYAAREGDLFGGERSREIRQLLDWSKKTRDGSEADLAFNVSDETWEAVMSDKDDCLRAQCPFFNECFFYKSRREAASADVVVANHHLVLADLALKKDHKGNEFTAILPPYERIVFDEAHHLEEVATSYFSGETSLLGIRRQLQKLLSLREHKGALVRLDRAVSSADSSNLYPATKQIKKLLSEDVPMRRQGAETVLDALFGDLFQRTLEYFNIGELKPREKRELRVTSAVTATPFWEEVNRIGEEVLSELNLLIQPLQKALNLVKFYPVEILREIMDAQVNLTSCVTKLEEHANSLRFFLKAGEEEFCRWFEVGYFRGRPQIRPCVAPLEIAEQLREALFAKKKTVVVTSATLTVENRFDFLSRQLGLGPEMEKEIAATGGKEKQEKQEKAEEAALHEVSARTDFLQLGSPFDYERNCLAGIPLDIASPESRQFEASSSKLVFEALRITQGRAFVLFTSYRSLEVVYEALHDALAREGIKALRQGEMPRHHLLDAFRSTPNAALFATSSFWEGVDVQGRALETLILCRLPFKVPTTPILEARTERLERNGGNSFRELALPLAVIKFKQGFGRLIRSKADRGVVLILDHRVVTKPYGKTFLRSLPPLRVVQASTPEVLEAFRRFCKES